MSDVQLACSGSEDVPPALGERLGRALRPRSHDGGGGGKRGSGNGSGSGSGSGSERGKRAGGERRGQGRGRREAPQALQTHGQGHVCTALQGTTQERRDQKRTWPGATRGSPQLSSAQPTPGHPEQQKRVLITHF